MAGEGTPQFSFAFPERALTFEELDVTESNKTAFSVIRAPENWGGVATCLIGEPDSGLTTACMAWAIEQRARYLTAIEIDHLSNDQIDELTQSNIVIDRADRVDNQDALLSVLNLSDNRRQRVFLSSRTSPSAWSTGSADLASRLKSMPTVSILPPDEDMIGVRLRAAARRRYLRLDDRLVAYLVTRVQKSYRAVELFIRQMDDKVEETGKSPTIPMAREILDEGHPTGQLFSDQDTG